MVEVIETTEVEISSVQSDITMTTVSSPTNTKKNLLNPLVKLHKSTISEIENSRKEKEEAFDEYVQIVTITTTTTEEIETAKQKVEDKSTKLIAAHKTHQKVLNKIDIAKAKVKKDKHVLQTKQRALKLAGHMAKKSESHKKIKDHKKKVQTAKKELIKAKAENDFTIIQELTQTIY